VDKLDKKVELLCNAIAAHQSEVSVQQAFRDARLAYKKIELVLEYYHPYTAQFINSPAIQKNRFQELELLLFPAVQPAAYAEAKKLQSVMSKLQQESEVIKPTDAQLFDAMRLELVRIMSLGLSGFDSPKAHNSLPEAVASLEGINEIWKFYVPTVSVYNPAVVKYMDELLTAAKVDLQGDNFDKKHFVTEYVNNLAINLKMAREALRIPYDNQKHILDPAASTIFAKNAILPLYSAPDSINLKSMNDSAAGYLHALLRQNSALNSYVQK
jgi:cytochrome c peroxidase